jgi:RNA-binding protein 39
MTAAATATTVVPNPSAMAQMTTMGNVGGMNIEEDLTKIGNTDHPTEHILVHNMFDKDTEVEPDWQNDIREEFIEECSKHGKITTVVVAYQETGGKIYASFAELDGAQKCATSLAGRWFDKRRLRVEFIEETVIRAAQERYPS